MSQTTPDSSEFKIIIALVGVVCGWLLKTIWEEISLRLRWRRLAPVVLRQLQDAGALCEQSFDATRLPIILSKLVSAQGSAMDLVANGVQTKQWLTGLDRAVHCLDAARAVEASRPESIALVLITLREAGQQLLVWAHAVHE